MSDHQEDFVNNMGWFIAGAVAGMTAALFLAPQSGKQTRRFIADKTQQGRDAVSETGKDVVDRGKDGLTFKAHASN